MSPAYAIASVLAKASRDGPDAAGDTPVEIETEETYDRMPAHAASVNVAQTLGAQPELTSGQMQCNLSEGEQA
jgi:hypothetical protein